MEGGRLEIALEPLAAPASHGREQRRIPRRDAIRSSRSGPLAQVASGGELSRVALAIHVVTSEVGDIPTLVFDEVDTGIGGAGRRDRRAACCRRSGRAARCCA